MKKSEAFEKARILMMASCGVGSSELASAELQELCDDQTITRDDAMLMFGYACVLGAEFMKWTESGKHPGVSADLIAQGARRWIDTFVGRVTYGAREAGD